MTTSDTGAQAPTAAAANGQAPPAAEPPCDTCVSKGELALAILGIAAGAFIILMGADLATGGKIGRAAGLGRPAEGEITGDGNSGS